MTRPPELIRLVRFCEVGATNTVLTLAVFTGLVQVGCPAWLASALAFVAGAVNGYHWNARWTFADRRTSPPSGPDRTRARYVAVQAIGTGASAAGVAVAQGTLGLAHLPAEVVILPIVTVLSYTLMRSVVFATDDAPPAAA